MGLRKRADVPSGGDSGSDDDEPIGDTPTELRRVRNELRAVKRSRKRDRWIFGLIAVVFLLGIGANRLQAREIDERDRDGQSRDLAGLIGNCAVAEVYRIAAYNQLVSLRTERPFATTPSFDRWLDGQLAVYQPVDCAALIPPKDRASAKLCLQYPPRLDPATGQPVPTTTTPRDAKACGG